MKISVSELEEISKLYTAKDVIDKMLWNIIKGAISSVAKYKLLGIRGNMYANITE